MKREGEESVMGLEAGVGSRALREGLIVVAATLACLLPFADKAFHIDDHRYVQMAQQIQESPLDFFGFTVNLGNSEQPEAAVSHNPPLIAFYAAAAAFITGWSEVGLHLAFLLPALAARGRLLAAWCLSGPVRQDLAGSLLEDGNLAGFGVAQDSVVDRREAAETVRTLDRALAGDTAELRVEKLPGPFLWHF